MLCGANVLPSSSINLKIKSLKINKIERIVCARYNHRINYILYTCVKQLKLSMISKKELKIFGSTVKHVYSDHAYNEITLITKHL